MNKIGILLIHGSGTDHSEKLENFKEKVLKFIRKKGLDTNLLEFEIVNWHPAIQVNQEQLWDNYLDSDVKLGWKVLRKFILFNIADNFVYNNLKNESNSVYNKIHNKIYESVLNLKSKVPANSPIIIISSSMGTVIALDYIWDRQNTDSSDPLGKDSFEKLEFLAGLLMFGSTLPMYAGAYPASTYKCITFPPQNLPGYLNDVASWNVYYDKQDVLGYPVKPVNNQYKQQVSIEKKVNIGGLFSFWNPASHLWYWKSKKIQKKVADYIEKVISYL